MDKKETKSKSTAISSNSEILKETKSKPTTANSESEFLKETKSKPTIADKHYISAWNEFYFLFCRTILENEDD